jgi:predicted ArsR family transcriptional regulator
MKSDDAAALVTDRYSSQIIFATSIRPKSAQGMSQQYGIPIAACYRRIKSLEELGLIECKERFLNQRGKWVRMYISTVKSMDVVFENGRTRVRVSFKDGRTSHVGEDVISQAESDLYRS